jgi:hypothetical protein
MADPDFGWTAEMQVKALRHGLRVTRGAGVYRRRGGLEDHRHGLGAPSAPAQDPVDGVLRHGKARGG